MFEAIVDAAVFGVAIPALVAGLILVVAWRPWSESAPEQSRWGGGLAILLGFQVGYISLNWKADAIQDSLLGMVGEPKQMGIAVGIAAAVAVVEHIVQRRPWIRGIGFAAGLIGVTVVVAGYLIGDPWGIAGTGLRLAVIVVAFGAASLTLEHVGREHPGASLPLVLVVFGTGGALVMTLSGTARVGQHLGILTCTAGAALVVAWWRGAFRLAGPGIRAFLVLFATLYLHGYFSLYDASLAATLSLVAAPQAVWLQHVAPMADLEGWKATVARVMFVAVAIGAAIFLAWSAGGGSSYGY
jgi:hypothetical protein